uniref:Uncharacterized protein n=1 Tax=Ditylenchus dipsaci TaxID=166011 RepID=A0A915CQC7_9BILA
MVLMGCELRFGIAILCLWVSQVGLPQVGCRKLGLPQVGVSQGGITASRVSQVGITQVTDDDLEKANESRDSAAAAFSEGDFTSALQHYTKAIEANPSSAMLFCQTSQVGSPQAQKPMSAIRDCDKAISINPDSAQGYKFVDEPTGCYNLNFRFIVYAQAGIILV